MKSLKKIFSSFVALLTIAWSVGIGTLALPGVASAATLTSGDLIKASTPAVYYYGGDGKRYVFPNEKTYKTWYADFSSVKTITDAELAAIQIGGNATYKPGVKMVKITTDPKVYAVDKGGSLRWVSTEALATSLYGSTWNQMIDDVPDAFFVNYSVGSAINVATDFTPATVTTAATSINADKNIGGAGSNTNNNTNNTNTVSGSVTAALATDTPVGMTVTKNASSVPLFKFSLTAGSAEALITQISVHRVGIGASTDFSNVYLFDGDSTRLTSGRTVNSQTNIVVFGSLSISVPANTTKNFMIYGDFSTPSTTGGQHGFELTNASSVTLSGSATVGGTFPVRGNLFTVGSASSGRLDVKKGTTPSNPYIGSQDTEVSNFQLVANTNDIEVRRITLLQAGSITNTNLKKLTLYQGGTPVATADGLTGDKIVLNFNPAYVIPNGQTKTLSLHAAVNGRTTDNIRTYVEYTTDVYAVDKTYNTGAAVDIGTNGTFDGTSWTSCSSAGNSICVTLQGGQLTSSFNGPVSQNYSKGSTEATLFKFSIAAASNIEVRKLYFNISSTNSGFVKGGSGTEYFTNIKVKNLDTGTTVMGPVSMPSTVANRATQTGTITMTDAFTMKAGQVLNMAVMANLSNSEDTDRNFFTNGTSTYQVIWSNNGASTGNLFGSTDVRLTDTGEYLTTNIVPNSAITGNSMTVKSSSLAISLAGSPSSGTVVKKQANISTTGLVLTAGGQSDITVTQIKLTGQGKTASGAYIASDLANVVNSCGFWDGATPVGLAQGPDTTLGTMTISNMSYKIAAGSSKTLIVKCTADSIVNSTGTGDLYSVGIAAVGDVTAQDGSANSVTPTLTAGVTGVASGQSPSVFQTVTNGGTLTIATDNLRASTILVADGSTWQNLAQFKATAQNEDISIDRIAVTSTGDAANFTAVAIAKDGATKGWDILPSGVMKAKDIDLSGAPMTVPKDGSVTFQVWAKLATTQSSSTVSGATSGVSRSGNTLAAGVSANQTTGEWDSNYNDKFNVRATGAASGQRVYATSTNMTGGAVGNTFVVRRTVPTVTRQNLSTTTLAPGDLDLYKFQVAADAGGSISVKKMVFTLTTATGTASTMSLSNFRLRRGTTDIPLANLSVLQFGFGDLTAGTWVNSVNASSTNSNKVTIVFSNNTEETISGSGNVYTLHATVGGNVVSGDTVNVSLARTADTNVNTGYLTDTNTATVLGPHINTSTTAVGTANAIGYFVWSDQSEVPHSGTSSGITNQSRDWMDDLYVQDLTQSSILSR